ncbi:MAG TPA: HAD-IIIA family hydrolase [Phnomibacter sp.]|nr:HAD-IIIA family hydrolase [Phnomibacter sp.]
MNVLSLFKSIKAFAFDVDGVLTDGTLFLMPVGEMVRRMNIKDGYALQLAVKKGYHVIIISGGNSELVQERLEKLGVTEVHMQVHDKAAVLQQFMDKHQLSKEQVLFMGDDMPDLEVMSITGLPCSPADGCTEVKEASLYISPCKGGEGAARDVIEKVLKLNDHWHHNTTVQSR